MRKKLLVAATLLSLTAGCSLMGSKTIKREVVEKSLKKWLIGHDLEASAISCPDKISRKVGTQVDCHATIHKISVPITVEVIAKGYKWNMKYLTMPRAKIEQSLVKNKTFAGHKVDLDCHEKVWVSVPDSAWTCDVTDLNNDKKFLATVTFKDGEGNYKIKVREK